MARVMTGFAWPNALMQHALGDLEPLSIDVGHLQERCDRVVGALHMTPRGTGRFPGGTFYILTRSPEGDDQAFAERLAMRDVFVLPGATFEMPTWFRISLTTNDAMIERALPVFAKAIAKVGVGAAT